MYNLHSHLVQCCCSFSCAKDLAGRALLRCGCQKSHVVCCWCCSKVSIPVDKAIGLMEWVQSLGHDVPELGELQGLKKRCEPCPWLFS